MYICVAQKYVYMYIHTQTYMDARVYIYVCIYVKSEELQNMSQKKINSLVFMKCHKQKK